MGYAQAAIKCIVNTSSKQNYKATHRGFAVFGIRYSEANQPTSQATGEWVGDEKIAERRVATKASQTSQSSPRVFSEIFCSTHPERGARPPTVQAPPASNPSQPTMQVPPASNASPPRWNASPNPSPIKQPESQVFQIAGIKNEATAHMQPHSARIASQIYRTALIKTTTSQHVACVKSY